MKKQIAKRLLLTMLAIGLMSNIELVSADNGTWKQTESKWWYENIDGSYKTNQWMKENKTWYYFDEQGYMVTDWAKINGEWYYFSKNGQMKTGWLSLGKDWYYLKDNGAMQIGWKWLNGKWYYLNKDGKMRTGWLQEGQNWYYLNPDGSMAVDTWIDECYVNSAGVWSKVAQSDDYGEIVENVAWTEEEVIEKINELRAKFPDGMYWNHMGLDPELKNNSNIVTSIPCDHAQNGMSYCNNYVLGNIRGYQCDGFTRKMSDLVFSPEAPIIEYEYDFDKVKVGDYLRYNDIHTVFVIGKGEDYINIVEANYGDTCKIRWDGRLSKITLEKLSIETFTRYE